MSLHDDVLHLRIAEQNSHLGTSAHPVAGVLEHEVIVDGRLQLALMGMTHQQLVDDEPGALIDDRRRSLPLVNRNGLVWIDDLIPQVEKPSAPGHGHPNEPYAAAFGQAC